MRFQTLVVACAIVVAAFAPVVAAPKAAHDFTLELFSGTTFRLADARGRAVVLLFWAPW
jgi:cytochrome oxidase Cu insertion factor (SCO1/SenC/PrrC family)